LHIGPTASIIHRVFHTSTYIHSKKKRLCEIVRFRQRGTLSHFSYLNSGIWMIELFWFV
jgi:hypothetical protein